MSKRQIYTVFACDEWKSKDNMRLLMAMTSVRKLKSFIVRKISDEEFDYGNSDAERVRQVKWFKEDFDKEHGENINGGLGYGYLEYCYDVEEI